MQKYQNNHINKNRPKVLEPLSRNRNNAKVINSHKTQKHNKVLEQPQNRSMPKVIEQSSHGECVSTIKNNNTRLEVLKQSHTKKDQKFCKTDLRQYELATMSQPHSF